MSDKKIGLKSTLKLSPKIELKRNEPNVEATERLVDKIHEVPEEPVAQESKRITLDIPIDLYKDLKRAVFDEGITLKKYILDLVRDNLQKK